MKGAIVNLTAIAVYAPTLDTEEEVKDSFLMTFKMQSTELPQETC